MILGLVGTLAFDRLVQMLDDYAARNPSEQVLIQLADSQYRPRAAQYFTFKPRESILDLYKTADVVVAHAGMGTIIDASAFGARLVLVPRLSRLREHVDDHQLQIAGYLNTKYDVPVVPAGAELDQYIALAKRVPLANRSDDLARRIAAYIESL